MHHFNSETTARKSVKLQFGESYIQHCDISLPLIATGTPTKHFAASSTITRPLNSTMPKLPQLNSTAILPLPLNLPISPVSLDFAINFPEIKHLPGKKEAVVSKEIKSKCKNRCEICSVIFDSKQDKELKKRFKKQNLWIGCDVEHCDYCAYAHCLNLTVMKDVEDIPFLCPVHNSST